MPCGIVDVDGLRFGAAAPPARGAGIILQRGPGTQAGADLLGEHAGIGRRLESFLRHGARRLVIAVTIARAAHEHRRDHQRPHHAHHAHHVGEHAVVRPAGDGFGLGLRKAVVDHARPVLIDAVVAAGLQQFHRADQAERVEIVVGHHVGPTLAAVESEQRDARPPAARFVGEHAPILIVGVRGDHDQAGARVQFLEALPERGRAPIRRDLLIRDHRLDRRKVRRLRGGVQYGQAGAQQDSRQRGGFPWHIGISNIVFPAGLQGAWRCTMEAC